MDKKQKSQVLSFRPIESMSWQEQCSSDDNEEYHCVIVQSGSPVAEADSNQKPKPNETGNTSPNPPNTKAGTTVKTGRPRNSMFDELGFNFVRRLNKYFAVCGVCGKELQNTAARRLRGHRNVCPRDSQPPTDGGTETPHSEPLTAVKAEEDVPESYDNATSTTTTTSTGKTLQKLRIKIEQRRLQALEQEIAFNRKTHSARMNLYLQEFKQKRQLHNAKIKAQEAKRLYYEIKLANDG